MLAVAKELYDFADNYRDIYDNSIPDASAFYQYVLLTTVLTLYCKVAN